MSGESSQGENDEDTNDRNDTGGQSCFCCWLCHPLRESGRAHSAQGRDTGRVQSMNCVNKQGWLFAHANRVKELPIQSQAREIKKWNFPEL